MRKHPRVAPTTTIKPNHLRMSFGAGLHSPRCTPFDFPTEGAVERVARELETTRRNAFESWFTLCFYDRNQRCLDAWAGSSGVVLNVDYKNSRGEHVAIPSDIVDLVIDNLAVGNIAYATPGGLRVCFLVDRPMTDQSTWLEAVERCLLRVGRNLESLRALATKECEGCSHSGFISSTQDFMPHWTYLTPRARMRGESREAKVWVLRTRLHTHFELSRAADGEGVARA